jgi:hypothetical protein
MDSLSLTNNSIESTNIIEFSHLVNLKKLAIANTKEEICNKFFGSLIVFKDFKDLDLLEISNTDINEGVNYLPLNLMNIYYAT